MNGFAAVYKKELWSLWVTPLAWVLLTVFLLLQGTIFYSIVTHFANVTDISVDVKPLQTYFKQESIFLLMTLLLLCPTLSIRLFAKKRRSNTIEALLTAPVTPTSVVLGKYLATLSTYVVMWAPTALYVVILRKTGSVDWGVVASSYLGLLGIGAAYLSLGTLMSAMTKSQLVALLLTIFLEFGLFILGIGEYIFDAGVFRDVCAHVSVMSQMEDFAKGIVDLRRLVFDGSLTVVSLFLTVRVVDSWRWG